jgi:predicted PolB exonuclease-like 3'-5' exonuclease
MQHQNLFVFDIETIPDAAAAKRLLNLETDDKNEGDELVVGEYS